MIYENIRKALFIDRPNRFVAHIEVDGKPEVCHVKNTGRCRELLLPGATVYVQEFETGLRKTRYDLITVVKGDRLVNMDSQAPNKAFGEWVKNGKFLPGVTCLRPECRFSDSRFDFYLEQGDRKAFVEVKGVTLEEDGVALFPDAPTERGVKHIRGMMECQQLGYDAYIVFIIQTSPIRYFKPNTRTHKEFADILKQAQKCGVQVIALDCAVTEDSMTVGVPVEVRL